MAKIKKNLGISISVGLLSGIWVLIAEKLGVPAWPGFIGWSLFFFTGGNLEACKKSFPCIVLGPILAYLTVYTQTALNTSGITSALVVVALGFTMTIAQSFPLFAVCSVTFVSCNIYFASGSLFHSIVVTSIGLIIGIISVKFGALLDSIILKDKMVLRENN
ncbi:DUF1097 domain-containing protein [Tissierella carlieri]|uniref:DUF1097 domain-containing protein n=1 Tax=Tissierella carlieri TaxID=689904 RepID=A0ABT1SG48_9FIRM|nr:DUF1097 domain-containing protein [Tissierella carlieri]